MKKPASFVISTLCLLLAIGCGGEDKTGIDKQKLEGRGKVYFLPLGDFPSSTVKELVSYYQEKHNLSIETLPPLPLEPSVTNAQRQQLAAEAVVAQMKSALPSLADAPEAIIIGLTREDMYIAQYNWRFTFSWRQEGKYAVVSNARMYLGEASERKAMSRLRKMVTKNIGILYYRLQQSEDPRSVLYKNVGGIEEPDNMGEEL
jgi:predicted Zn-dependent protease